MIRHMIKIMLGSIPNQKLSFIIYLLEDEQELSLGMLIRLHRIYNFLLFHANIIQLSYTFGNFLYYFGTNILIQCPVLVPVCCMFYVSQKTNIKRNPNRIKMDGELFWNICDFWEVKSTRDGARGGQEIGGAWPYLRIWRPCAKFKIRPCT